MRFVFDRQDLQDFLQRLEGVKKVMISQQVVEGTAGPLYMYAARAGGARRPDGAYARWTGDKNRAACGDMIGCHC